MYTLETLKKGIEFLGITDPEEISDIIQSNKDNVLYLEEQEEIKRRREIYNNRMRVPIGKTKKEYTALLKETQVKIDYLLKQVQKYGPDEGIFFDIERERYVEKKLKINKILKHHKEYGTLNIQRAKEYPIDQLLEFNNAGFTSCPFHGPEKTPSAKLYHDRNKIHCFGCGIDADVIDVYQKIYNVTLPEAVRKLS